MRSRSWLVLAIGFGALVLLIGLLGFGAMRQAQALHDETVSAHDAYLQTDAVLREIPADLYLGDILIRDYLLDLSHLMATGSSFWPDALRSSTVSTFSPSGFEGANRRGWKDCGTNSKRIGNRWIQSSSGPRHRRLR
jgi:hypothetical protein